MNVQCFRTMAAFFFIICSSSLIAQEKIHVAVAANYIKPFKELAQIFEEKTGLQVEATFSSSGNLYSQITNGAPYDLFLSADEERPALLVKAGEADKQFIYAKGRVVLWSARKDFCKSKDWREALKKGNFKKIAIANPATAPYGLAAESALRKTGLFEAVKPKLVNSQDIALSFQYASTEAADAGFCALSAVYSPEGQKGCFYYMEEAPEVVQSACVLKRSKNYKAAEKFAAFLVSPEAVKIKTKYGYR